MRVFVSHCYLYSVVGDFTCKRLRWCYYDNNYYQCCILLENGVGRTVSSYEFLVFCTSLLLSLSCYRWLCLVPCSSRSFFVLVCTEMFVVYISKQNTTKDTLPAAKTRKGSRKIFNVWTKSHFSNFGMTDVPLVTKMFVGGCF